MGAFHHSIILIQKERAHSKKKEKSNGPALSLSLSEARAILIPLHLPQRSAANWQPRPAAAAFLANGEVLKC